jgi:hypothetical protein
MPRPESPPVGAAMPSVPGPLSERSHEDDCPIRAAPAATALLVERGAIELAGMNALQVRRPSLEVALVRAGVFGIDSPPQLAAIAAALRDFGLLGGAPRISAFRRREPAKHFHAHPDLVHALHLDYVSHRIRSGKFPRNLSAPYWVARAALLMRATPRLAVRRPTRADAAQSREHGAAATTVRVMFPVADAERINATRRECVKMIVLACPSPAKPAHRHWAEPRS